MDNNNTDTADKSAMDGDVSAFATQVTDAVPQASDTDNTDTADKSANDGDVSAFATQVAYTDKATPSEQSDKEPSEGKADIIDADNLQEQIKVDDGAGWGIDYSMIRELAPTLNDLGITPNQVQVISNKMAEIQTASAKDEMANRTKMLADLSKKASESFDKSDWTDIGSAVNKYFAPDSAVRDLLMHTELGSDIEVLTMLRDLGQHHRADSATGIGNSSEANSDKGFASRWSGGQL